MSKNREWPTDDDDLRRLGYGRPAEYGKAPVADGEYRPGITPSKIPRSDQPVSAIKLLELILSDVARDLPPSPIYVGRLFREHGKTLLAALQTISPGPYVWYVRTDEEMQRALQTRERIGGAREITIHDLRRIE